MEAIIPKDDLDELPTGFALCGHIGRDYIMGDSPYANYFLLRKRILIYVNNGYPIKD